MLKSSLKRMDNLKVSCSSVFVGLMVDILEDLRDPGITSRTLLLLIINFLLPSSNTGTENVSHQGYHGYSRLIEYHMYNTHCLHLHL